MYYLASAFSLNMIPDHTKITADIIPDEYVRSGGLGQYLKEHEAVSIVGHASAASLMTTLLQMDVPVNREQITVAYGDSIYVCQVGIRLGEGQVLTLDELKETPITFRVVTVMEN